jgi:very-short-patch-repair endonuclease
MPRKADDINPLDVATLYAQGTSLSALGSVTMRPVRECIAAGIANMTPEQRQAMTASAHRAVKGMTRTEKDLCQRAATRERLGQGISRSEAYLSELLSERGHTVTLQKAIGRYNVDLALHAAPVAVEVFGGHWHSSGRHAARFRQRNEYILDAGWRLVYIWVTRPYPLESCAVEQIISLAESLRRGESVGREELMIYGNGQPAALGKYHFD